MTPPRRVKNGITTGLISAHSASEHCTSRASLASSAGSFPPAFHIAFNNIK
jgi:hypothetical protein